MTFLAAVVPAHKEKVLTSGGMLIASGEYIDEYIRIRIYFLSLWHLTEDKKNVWPFKAAGSLSFWLAWITELVIFNMRLYSFSSINC